MSEGEDDLDGRIEVNVRTSTMRENDAVRINVGAEQPLLSLKEEIIRVFGWRCLPADVTIQHEMYSLSDNHATLSKIFAKYIFEDVLLVTFPRTPSSPARLSRGTHGPSLGSQDSMGDDDDDVLSQQGRSRKESQGWLERQNTFRQGMQGMQRKKSRSSSIQNNNYKTLPKGFGAIKIAPAHLRHASTEQNLHSPTTTITIEDELKPMQGNVKKKKKKGLFGKDGWANRYWSLSSDQLHIFKTKSEFLKGLIKETIQLKDIISVTIKDPSYRGKDADKFIILLPARTIEAMCPTADEAREWVSQIGKNREKIKIRDSASSINNPLRRYSNFYDIKNQTIVKTDAPPVANRRRSVEPPSPTSPPLPPRHSSPLPQKLERPATLPIFPTQPEVISPVVSPNTERPGPPPRPVNYRRTPKKTEEELNKKLASFGHDLLTIESNLDPKTPPPQDSPTSRASSSNNSHSSNSHSSSYQPSSHKEPSPRSNNSNHNPLSTSPRNSNNSHHPITTSPRNNKSPNITTSTPPTLPHEPPPLPYFPHLQIPTDCIDCRFYVAAGQMCPIHQSKAVSSPTRSEKFNFPSSVTDSPPSTLPRSFSVTVPRGLPPPVPSFTPRGSASPSRPLPPLPPIPRTPTQPTTINKIFKPISPLPLTPSFTNHSQSVSNHLPVTPTFAHSQSVTNLYNPYSHHPLPLPLPLPLPQHPAPPIPSPTARHSTPIISTTSRSNSTNNSTITHGHSSSGGHGHSGYGHSTPSINSPPPLVHAMSLPTFSSPSFIVESRARYRDLPIKPLLLIFVYAGPSMYIVTKTVCRRWKEYTEQIEELLEGSDDEDGEEEADDNKNVIIIDNGSFQHKAGLAGRETPEFFFTPSFTEHKGIKRSGELIATKVQPTQSTAPSQLSVLICPQCRAQAPIGKKFCGDCGAAINLTAPEQKKDTRTKDTTPQTKEVLDITEWEVKEEDYKEYERVWEGLFKEMKVDPKAYKIVITKPILAPKEYEDRLLSILLDKFKVPGVFIEKQPVLTSYCYGYFTALAIDIGHTSCQIAPLVDGQLLEESFFRVSHLSGRYMQMLLENLMRPKAGLMEIDPASSEFSQTVRKVRETMLEVVEDYDEAMHDPSKHSKKLNIPANPPFRKSPTTVTLSKELFMAAELLFEPRTVLQDAEDSFYSLPELIEKCINSVAIDNRERLLSTIVLSGGVTKIPGFDKRLETELKDLLPHIATKIKVFTNLTNREQLVWAGGSLFVSTSEDIRWIDQFTWKERSRSNSGSSRTSKKK